MNAGPSWTALLLVVPACRDEPPGTTDSDVPTASGHSYSSTECGSPDLDVLPSISRVGVECDPIDGMRVDLLATMWTSSGALYLTNNGTAPAWSENHTLASYEFDAMCGTYDKLDVRLATGATPEGQVTDVSTVFTCAHLEGGVMSFAAMILDFDGNFADCLVWGVDPGGLIDGTNRGAGDPLAFDVTSCAVGLPTR